MRRRRLWIWGPAALLYVVFSSWYTDFGGPLSEAEIESYLGRLDEIGLSPSRRDRIQRFMEGDTGRQFFMVNVVDYAEDPPDVEGASPGESASELMNRYMEHMFRALFARACHPTILGNAVHEAVDLVGVDSLERAERWDMGAVFRYRSRRTFLEVLTIPETLGRHAFKVAALEKTIAYPVETGMNLGDPRVLLGLLLLASAALGDLMTTPRSD